MALLCALGPNAVSAQPAPVAIDVILSQTGNGAFLGLQELAALDILERVVNEHGGVNGRALKFVFYDDQSNPVVAVQLANTVIANGAQMLLGPTLVGSCSAIMPLAAKNNFIDYCFSPVMSGPAGGNVFTSGAGSDQNFVVALRYFRQRGWKRLAVLVATDAGGKDGERQIDAALQLPENSDVRVVAREHFNPTDISINAQVAKVKSSSPQALLTSASGAIFGTAIRSLHDAGVDVPTYSSSGNMVYAQLAQYTGILPSELYFAATRGVVPEPKLGKGPVSDAQRVYFDAFRAAGKRPEFGATLVWDPAMIAVDALRNVGPNASAQQIHDYIESLQSWAGIAGIYYFRDNGQRGIGQNALTVYRWDATHQVFIVATRPGGRL